ncbi:MAG: hypothetical protein Q8P29_01860 [Candidatus Levybacteria bacterium]|nr:hypothetical protein [Candidatus Levybacteria bacterium]
MKVSIMYRVLSIIYGTLRRYFFAILIILNTLYFILNAGMAQAQTMSNDNYIIKMQGFNAFSGVTGGEDYKLRSTVGDLSPVVGEGVNFKVKTGFENLASASPFSILLSSSLVDFGILSPTNPIIRTVDLTMNSLTAYGYSVLVFENEPLVSIPSSEANSAAASKTFIPDTACDNGQCSAENAAQWSNALTYGFGYRCDNVTGADCDISFDKANFYKHFPDIANNDDPQPLMVGIGSNNKQTRISYKVNVSGTQAQGVYSNVITYIAIPNF